MLSLHRDIPNAEAMETLGAALAATVSTGLVIYLHGELGAGKTTLVRGVLRGLGFGGPVRSPTYTLIEPYEIADRSLYHLDLYRLGAAEELEWLGIRDLFDGRHLVMIEWPERGAGYLPPPDVDIQIDYIETGRRIGLVGHTEPGQLLLRQLDTLHN